MIPNIREYMYTTSQLKSLAKVIIET